MKKGEVYHADFGRVRVLSMSTYGVLVKYLSGPFEGREARIDNNMMKGKKRFIEVEEKKND